MMAANFEEELELFKELLRLGPKKSLLTIQAKSLYGKTTLLGEYEEVCKNSGCLYAKTNLKRPYDPHAILDYLCEQLGQTNLPNYWALSEKMIIGDTKISIENTSLYLSDLRVSQISPKDPKGKHRRLSIEFFRDATSLTLKQPVVLLFDHYEKSTDEVREWMQSDFLPKLPRVPNIITVIAGQDVPASDDDFRSVHQPIELGEIEIEHWVKYTGKTGPSLSRNDIAMIYDGVSGVPGMIAIAISYLQNQG
jgi:hypothetical protein